MWQKPNFGDQPEFEAIDSGPHRVNICRKDFSFTLSTLLRGKFQLKLVKP